MKVQVLLTITGGPDVTSDEVLERVAACVGFANQMGLPMRMVPEEQPRGGLGIALAVGAEVPAEYKDEFAKAKKVMAGQESMAKKEFVRAVAKALGREPKSVGSTVRKWLKIGMLLEVERANGRG